MKRTKMRIGMLLLGALLGLPGPTLAQESAEVGLRAAMEAETVEGNLNAAIEQYKKLAEGSDRMVAAKALIRMAGCYEKLGTEEASRIYERVLREFADQKEAAAVARARLGAIDPVERVKGDRVVLAGENVIYGGGSVSPDGRLIGYTDWFFTGKLMLHDLASGSDRSLNDEINWGASAMSLAFSKDGKQVAYSWADDRVVQIFIARIDEIGVKEPRTVLTNNDLAGIGMSDWSPDGKWLAVLLARKDRTRQIALANIQDGSLRTLKSQGWRGADNIFFSPDGKHLAYNTSAGDTGTQDVFVIAIDGSGEAPAVVDPSRDVVMGWSPDGGHLFFTSDRTGSNGLWALPIADGKPKAAPLLVKPNIGSVESLGLTASGTLYIAKDTSTRGLRIAPIDPYEGKLLGTPDVQSYSAIARPAWSRDGRYFAYRSEGPTGDNYVSIQDAENGNVRELPVALGYFAHLDWSPDARWLVTSGRDLKGRTGVYRIDADTGAVAFVTSNRGRPKVSPGGDKIYVDGGDGRLLELELASGDTQDVYVTTPDTRRGPIELSPDGRYAAAVVTEGHPPGLPLGAGQRYGETSSIVLIPVAGGEARELIRVKWPERFATFSNMSWTPDSQALVVVKSLSDTQNELWFVPIGDDQARKLSIDIEGWDTGGNRGFRLHPNGRQVAFFAGKQAEEIWALENVVSELSTKK